AGLSFDSRLAKSAGIACDAYGILVDDCLKTSVDGIFALGDCIVIDGVPCRFVATHRAQGSTIAAAIAGEPVPYQHTTPIIRLKNKSLSIQATGKAFAKTDWQQVSDVDGKLVMHKVENGQEIATLTVAKK
ncbi:MAG: FAD-dependent oxidoreductase, partial [Moraxella sp.]|nr:FAD-dependent oxidoreductase [Moraxella sp.]